MRMSTSIATPYPPWLINTSDPESIKAKAAWNSIMAKASETYEELIGYGYEPKDVQEILPDALKVVTLSFKELDAMVRFSYSKHLYKEVNNQGYKYVSELVSDLYNNQGFRIREIAETLDVAHVSIFNWMRLWKMPRRSCHERRSKKGDT